MDRSCYGHITQLVQQDKHTCQGKISSSFENKIGVNQGGVLSGLSFRKYLCDLGNYLKREVGVCIDQNILVHFLWADDLFVISNTVTGLQKQTDAMLCLVCTKKLKNRKNPPRDNAPHVWCNDQTNPGIRQRRVGNKQSSTPRCGLSLLTFC